MKIVSKKYKRIMPSQNNIKAYVKLKETGFNMNDVGTVATKLNIDVQQVVHIREIIEPAPRLSKYEKLFY